MNITQLFYLHFSTIHKLLYRRLLHCEHLECPVLNTNCKQRQILEKLKGTTFLMVQTQENSFTEDHIQAFTTLDLGPQLNCNIGQPTIYTHGLLHSYSMLKHLQSQENLTEGFPHRASRGSTLNCLECNRKPQTLIFGNNPKSNESIPLAFCPGSPCFPNFQQKHHPCTTISAKTD